MDAATTGACVPALLLLTATRSRIVVFTPETGGALLLLLSVSVFFVLEEDDSAVCFEFDLAVAVGGGTSQDPAADGPFGTAFATMATVFRFEREFDCTGAEGAGGDSESLTSGVSSFGFFFRTNATNSDPRRELRTAAFFSSTSCESIFSGGGGALDGCGCCCCCFSFGGSGCLFG